MNQMWAPWRMEYVEKDYKGTECVFCNKSQEVTNTTLVLYKTTHSFVVMNRFPYTHAHIMVIPIRHIKNLMELSQTELTDLFDLTRKAQDVLQKSLKPHGFNIGINFERVSGAGITEHLHIHIVPRWMGDVNFMPIFSETKVLPEHLETTYANLHKAFTNYYASSSEFVGR